MGRTCSPETKARISAANRGRVRTPEWRAKISASKKGKVPPITPEHRLKMVAGIHRGAEHHNWRGGVTHEHKAIRKTPAYRAWRTSVFEKDNYTCQGCGARGVYLEADHILSFADYPELRLELSNGRTMCAPCHRKTPTWGWAGVNARKAVV